MKYEFLKVVKLFGSEDLELNKEIFDTDNNDDMNFLKTYEEEGFTLDEKGRKDLEEQLLEFLYEDDEQRYISKSIFLKSDETKQLKEFLNNNF